MLPLEGLLVVSLEQAVAAPTCSCRLADAGARVIKIERPEGDFARGYDTLARGESAYFVWLNRGKESVVLDLTKADDKALLEKLLAKADVFIQNLKPGAIGKLGFAIERLRRDYPKLICCSISGFGESGPYAARKSYDLLVQAESGLASVTGGPEAPARVGVSVTDVASGMNAYEAVLEAIIARGRTGKGATISVSLFDAMADWMTVPLLHHEGGQSPKRLGLVASLDRALRRVQDRGRRRHPDLDPERPRMAHPRRGGDGRCGARRRSEVRHRCDRVKHRAETDGKVAAAFATMDVAALSKKLEAADIAFARVNDVAGLIAHPHLRRISVETPSGPVSYPAPAPIRDAARAAMGAMPALGEHTEKVRKEFG